MENNHLFPTRHPIFSTNKKLLHIIKKLEGYHEIYNDFLSLQATIASIRKLTAPPQTRREKSPIILCELLTSMDAIKELADEYYKTRDNFQALRDTLEDLIKKLGCVRFLRQHFMIFTF